MGPPAPEVGDVSVGATSEPNLRAGPAGPDAPRCHKGPGILQAVQSPEEGAPCWKVMEVHLIEPTRLQDLDGQVPWTKGGRAAAGSGGQTPRVSCARSEVPLDEEKQTLS